MVPYISYSILMTLSLIVMVGASVRSLFRATGVSFKNIIIDGVDTVVLQPSQLQPAIQDVAEKLGWVPRAGDRAMTPMS